MSHNTLKYYRIADIYISVTGNGAYVEALCNYFRTEEVSAASEPVLLSVIVENDPKSVAIEADYYSLSGKISFNNTSYCVQEAGYIYSVSHLFDNAKPVVMRICCTRKKNIHNWLRTLISPHSVGLGRIEDKFVDSVMNYACFLYIFAVLLLRRDKIFVHCGIVEKADAAFVMCGTGGCGKTSTLFNILQKGEYRYLAEDFGILGKDGYAYYMPKKMAVYQSDAKYKNPDVLKALKKLPLTYRLHWKLFELVKLNPRYRFVPEALFSEARVAKKAPVHKIVYLSRVRQDAPMKSLSISIDELCTKIRLASFRELRQLSEILFNIRAVGNADTRKCYPEPAKLEEAYEQLLRTILTDKPIGLLEVPLKAGPREIANYIISDAVD